MKVTVAIEFPCTQEEWARLEQIKALAGLENVSMPARIPERGDKFESQETILSDQDAMVGFEYVARSLGKIKPTQAELTQEYVQENPGCLQSEAIEAMSLKLGFTQVKLYGIIKYLLYKKKTITKIGGRLWIT